MPFKKLTKNVIQHILMNKSCEIDYNENYLGGRSRYLSFMGLVLHIDRQAVLLHENTSATYIHQNIQGIGNTGRERSPKIRVLKGDIYIYI